MLTARAFRGLLVLALPAMLAGQTPASFPCEAPLDLKAAIREAARVETEKEGQPRPFEQVREERQKRLKALVAQHPDNFWVLKAYLDMVKGPQASDQIAAEFQKRHAPRPDDLEATYLYAYALMGKDTPRTIGMLTALVEKTPAFPFPWLTLAQIYGYPNFNDPVKMAAHAERFLERCPNTSEAAQLAARLEKSDKLAAFTKALRRRIEGKADEETVHLYRNLWTLEFKITPLSEHAAVRQRVERDLRFLSGLDKEKFKVLSFLLPEGYKLTGNNAAQEKLAAEAKTSGDKLRAFFEAQREWSKANRPPAPGAAPERRTAYHEKRLQMLDEWGAKLPDEEIVRLERFRALSEIPNASVQVLLEEGEKVLEASRRKNSTVMMSTTAPMQVAAIWARRGIALDRVVAVLKEGMAALEDQYKRRGEMAHSDLFSTPDRRLMEADTRWHADTNAWHTLVLAYSKTSQIAEARNILRKWEAALAERRKRADEIRKQGEGRTASTAGQATRMRVEDFLVRSLPYDESRYFDALAELALVEHRKLDALTFYQSGLRAMAGATGAPADPAKSETGRKASDLWRELGGTQEGWQTWLDSFSVKTASAPGLPSRWSAMNRALPEFKLADQAGKTWAVTNLKGKTTLINVWATWCGPCRLELPHLQKLYDEVKDRPDVQVITLNVDENTGLIEPFLKENNYTFPVLLAKSFVDSFTGPLGIPTNWISDADASIRLESTGFGGDGDEWIQQTQEQMERVKGGKPEPKSVTPIR